VGSLGYATGRLAGTTNQEEALDGVNGHGVFTAVILDALKGALTVASPSTSMSP
jgi:hypothetical protein